MTLPLSTSYAPMDALLVDRIPAGDEWQYEPKWDGFRCLVFRDGGKVDLESKSGQSLGRYFPELTAALSELPASRFVIDGEIVVPEDHSISFDALLQRIHPAASRIRKLSVETPAVLVVFDLLVDEKGESLTEKPLAKRRQSLEGFARKYLKKNVRVVLSPATSDAEVARKWFAGVGAGGALDGIVAKRQDLPYQSGLRTGMVKIKRLRTADCVVGGFRYSTDGKTLGSLLLGLYDQEGLLNHVGFCSSFPAAQKKQVLEKIKPLIEAPGFTGQKPGGPSRWSTKRSSEWEPLASKLVVEIRYDHFSNGRFRHGTKFLRWRPDKATRQCTIEQVRQESAASPLTFA